MQRCITFVITTFVLAGLAAGCTGSSTPEQERADKLLATAKSQIGQGNATEGRALLHQAFALDRSINRAARYAEEAQLLGDMAAEGGDNDSALVWYGLARDAYRSVTDRASIRSLTIDMALIHQRMGEERQAFGILNDALRMARVFNEIDGVRDIQWSMLPLCRSLEHFDEGTKFLTELESHFTETHETQPLARVHYEWGMLYSASRDTTQAVQRFLKAYGLADQSQDTLLAVTSLLRLAILYEESGKSQEAFAAFGDGLKRAEHAAAAMPLRIELLTRVGNAYLRAGQTADAVRFYRAAFKVASTVQDKIAVGTLLVHFGHCAIGGSADAALKNYLSALEYFKSLGYAPGTAYASLSLSLARERSGDFAEAVSYAKGAIEQVEQSYAAPVHDLSEDCEESWTGPVRTAAYDQLISVLLHLGRNDEAFWYLERKNTRALSHVFRRLDIVTPEPAVNEAVAQLAHARAVHTGAERQLALLLSNGNPRNDEIVSVRRILDIAAREIADHTENVARLRPSFAQVVRGGGIGMAEAQRAVPAGSMLVEYAAAEKGLYSFVLTNTAATVAMAPVDRESIIAASNDVQRVLSERVTLGDSAKAEAILMDARIDELGARLYDCTVRPIAQQIGSAAKMLVVLPEELSGLPIHALRPALPKNSPYVAEKVFVSYVPSAGALATMNSATQQVKEVVAMGFAGRTDWDVEYELRDIRAFFKDARLYFNQGATLQTLEKEKTDLVHLAVDIHFPSSDPGTAYLVLSDGEAVAGPHFLLLGELFQVPAFPAIVISSLSDEHIGIHPSEPWIFLSNGTSAVLMNSYVPSRQSKKLFGELLYTGLLSGLGTQNAFRKAQLEMIKKQDAMPVYAWAPYEVWGK